jgi:drug/metabolite transporter (DMT)-like permease
MLAKIGQTGWNLNVPELTYYNSAIQIPFLYASCRYSGVDVLTMPRSVALKLWGRVTTGFVADCSLFLAFSFTNMSKAYCIFFTNNLMLPFFARCFIGEKFKLWDVIGIVFGFGGMILLV